MNPLARRIDEFEWSTRVRNALQGYDIHTIGDLVALTERDVREWANFGKLSMAEVKRVLASLGLHFGFSAPGFRQADGHPMGNA